MMYEIVTGFDKSKVTFIISTVYVKDTSSKHTKTKNIRRQSENNYLFRQFRQ